MDMNVSSLMRALLKDSQPSDARTLELRVGQIVRGVLLEVLDNNEVLMNINGTPVRAKLDAELTVGQSTLLQVQPDATGGLLTLKTLADVMPVVADEMLKDGVKSFGLPDQKWSFELLQGLKRDGYPIGRETADWFKQAAAAMPSGADPEAWMSAANVAFRRGLQPTETTIASLQQALNGPPLNEQLKSMAGLIQESLSKPVMKPETAALVERVGRLLTEGAALLADGAESLLSEKEMTVARGAATKTDTASPSAMGAKNQTDANPETAAVNAGTNGKENAQPTAGQSQVLAGRDLGGREQKAAALPLSGAPVDEAPDTEDRGAPLNGERTTPAASSANAENAKNASNATNASTVATEPKEQAWVGKFLQWLGVGHERSAVNAGGHAGQSMDPAAGSTALENGQPATSDTLKNALLALAKQDDAPPALKEAAQSLAQQITGQQLLLSAERQNTAMMSHMTLFIPMKNSQGDTTATIHVETRRGRKGEWDADNCRLLFDLKMQNLGNTLVDVQVVDKTVSLRLLNDRPWVSELVEAARGEATAGLQSAGYRLLSLTTSPYPTPLAATSETQAGTGSNLSLSERTGASAYAAKPYKGVDYRV